MYNLATIGFFTLPFYLKIFFIWVEIMSLQFYQGMIVILQIKSNSRVLETRVLQSQLSQYNTMTILFKIKTISVACINVLKCNLNIMTTWKIKSPGLGWKKLRQVDRGVDFFP